MKVRKKVNAREGTGRRKLFCGSEEKDGGNNFVTLLF